MHYDIIMLARFRLRGYGGRGGSQTTEVHPLRGGGLTAGRVLGVLRGVFGAHAHDALLHASK